MKYSEFFAANPGMKNIFLTYLLGLPFAALMHAGFGRPGGAAGMVAWGGMMFFYLRGRWPAGTKQYQAVVGLSAMAAFVGGVGLTGVL